MTKIFEPLFFERVLKEKIWGAQNFKELFDWKLPAGKKIGESWMLSDVPGEESRVRGGRYAGKTLRELMESSGKEILGFAAPAPGGRFPLLLKFLDTSDLLSVQVHPDDAMARQIGDGEVGKTEAWFFLQVEEGRKLTAGLKPGNNEKSLREAIETSKVAGLMEEFQVQPNEAVLIPAGLVHAIGPGFTLAEVQQTSDITYRLYDWDRMGDDGKPRTLHVDKGVRSTNYSLGKPTVQRPRWRRPTRSFREGQLIVCPHFRIGLGEVEDAVAQRTPGRAVMLMVTEGYGEIGWGAQNKVALDPGDTVLIPASLASYQLRASEGNLRCLVIEPGPF